MQPDAGTPPDRRMFLTVVADAALKLTAVAALAPALQGCADATGAGGGGPLQVNVSGLTQDGQVLVTSGNGPDGAPVVVVRQAAGEFVALSTVCTHQGCIVDDPSSGVMLCPCHGSEFNLQGAVLRGPAQAPLARFTVTLDAATNTLTIS
jgi:Rieske Fe-S protein